MFKKRLKILTISGMFILCFPCIFVAAEGDVDGSGKIDLKDVIAAIQVCAGMTPTSAVHAENDADGDGKIALADAVFAFQVASGIRPQTLFAAEGDEPVSINLSLLEPAAAESSLEIVLPDGDAATLVSSGTEAREEGNYTWSGQVQGQECSTVVLSVADGAMFGHIDAGGASYSLQPDGDGYRIVKDEPELIAPPGDDTVVPDIQEMKKRYAARGEMGNEDGSVIDVLVLYTAQMQTKYGSTLKSLIQSFVDLTNRAYKNSGVNTQLRLAGTSLYSSSAAQESSNINAALEHIADSAEIAALRDQYKADLVNLLRVYAGRGSCGLAYMMGSGMVIPEFQSHAFSVVEVGSVTEANPSYCQDYTFAHALGHNLGCADDRDHANAAGAYDYSYGYGIPGKFATIMSSDQPRITYFSTPKVGYQGNPLGKDADQPDSAYNALTINNTRVVAANFRVAVTTTVTVSSTTSSTVELTTTTTTVKPSTTTTTITAATTTIPSLIRFPDPNLDAAIRAAINKPSGDILLSDLQSLTSLSYDEDIMAADERKIKNLEGIQYCTNLTELSLDGNQISDVSPLAGLADLTKLYLDSNQIKDMSPLAGLAGLTWLSLGSNQISSVSALAGLTDLTELSLYSNQIKDISPLAGLTDLKWLWLSSNQIKDVSALAGLADLTYLYLDSNQIKDVGPLAGLADLTYLYLDSNQIKDVSPLAGLAGLKTLDLSSNQISSADPLAGLTNLAWLNLGSDQISDIKPLLDNSGIDSGDYVNLDENPLSITSCMAYIPLLQSREVTVRHNCQGTSAVRFPDPNLDAVIRSAINKPSGDILFSDIQNLTSLSYGKYGMADEKKIKNLEGIQYCTNLTSLNLIYNQISDANPLSGLTGLTWLSLGANRISSVSPLAGLTKLTWLWLSSNQIKDVSPLAGLADLTSLDLYSNQISDLSPLAGLDNLTSLYLEGNQISSVSPLAGLTDLRWLYLGGNQISDIKPLLDNSGIDSGDYVYLGGNPLNTTSCTVYIPQLQSRGVGVDHNCR